jgi:hypothetical protein
MINSLKSTRRVFIMQNALAATAVLAASQARAQAMVDPADPQAKALQYTAESTMAGKQCSNCALYQGGADAGGCGIFPGKKVAAKGWCSAWAKKA